MPESEDNRYIIPATHNEPVAPPEIFKEIIDQLAALLLERSPSQLKENMKSIAVVCKTFLPIARVHLFSEIDLSGQYDKTGVRRTNLAKFLVDERLAHRVQKVKYTFVHGSVEKCTASINEPLSVLLGLRQVESLSLSMIDEGWDSPSMPDAETPPFGWRSLLEGYINYGSLSTINIADIADVPIIAILSIPTLACLTMEECRCVYSNPETQDNVSKVPTPTQFNLKNLQLKLEDLQLSISNFPLALIVQCTQLQRLIVEDFVMLPRYAADELPSYLNLRGSRLPFRSLETAVFAIGENINWEFWYIPAEMEGLAGFPMLKNLTIGLHIDAPTLRAENLSNDLYRLFNHVPALETLRIYGTPTAALEIAQTLKPLEYTLKRLSLQWDFRHRGINPEDLITVKTVLGKIGALRLLVLEDLTLRLELETAIYQRDDTRHLAHRSVAKTLKSLLDDIIHDYDTNLPRLQRLEFEVSMIIYEKPKAYTPSAGKLYQAKAIRVLTRYLRGFEDNGKFNFVFNLNVYRRCTDRYCYHDSVSGEIRDDDDGGDGQDDVHDEDDATADEDSYESPLGESFEIPLFQ